MSETVTTILQFGEESAGSGLLLVAEIDRDMHQDGEGNPITSFLPGEAVYVLLHHDSGIRIVRIEDTASGDLQRIGEVVRQRTVQQLFSYPGEAVSLPHQPMEIGRAHV